MELTHGRLRAALIAGKIPVTDEALTILRAGLVTITHGYHLNKVLRGIKTESELKKISLVFTWRVVPLSTFWIPI